jgi:purine-cytosine permease-like protein
MYLGHFMAWISASILFAYQLERYPSNTDVLPGPMANEALGLAGLICVIIAGWTTANPTIYRAGLAFQAIAPKRSRFAITFMTGIAATIAGMFPAIAMKLLGFVALYGLLLMPIGAIIFVDFWLLKKIGLQSNYAYLKKQNLNWSVAITWIGTLTVCLWLVSRGSVQIYFISLPGWFMAAISYIVISYIYQRNIHASESLKKFISIISLLIIAAIAILIIGYFTDRVEDYHIKPWIWGLTIAWFITAGFWIR